MEIQQKMLAEVRRLIEAAGLEYVSRSDYANTGSIYAQRGFKTSLWLTYDFQRNYCGWSMRGPAVDASHITSRVKEGVLVWERHCMYYHRETDLAELFGVLTTVLSAVGKEET